MPRKSFENVAHMNKKGISSLFGYLLPHAAKTIGAMLVWLLAVHCQLYAQEAPVLPEVDELHITKTDAGIPSDARSSYMRIVLDREIKADKWTLLVLPAALDGYYFGPDAERFEVVAYDFEASPASFAVLPMEDTDDFLPERAYLVKSEGDVDSIVCLSPGVPTEVARNKEVQLLCMEFDDVAITDASGMTRVFGNDSGKRIYDLAGRAVKAASHGVFIVNGKKIFWK